MCVCVGGGEWAKNMRLKGTRCARAAYTLCICTVPCAAWHVPCNERYLTCSLCVHLVRVLCASPHPSPLVHGPARINETLQMWAKGGELNAYVILSWAVRTRPSMLGATVHSEQRGNSLQGVFVLELDLDRSMLVQAKRVRRVGELGLLTSFSDGLYRRIKPKAHAMVVLRLFF